jgi:hypothetical protein
MSSYSGTDGSLYSTLYSCRNAIVGSSLAARRAGI